MELATRRETNSLYRLGEQQSVEIVFEHVDLIEVSFPDWRSSLMPNTCVTMQQFLYQCCCCVALGNDAIEEQWAKTNSPAPPPSHDTLATRAG
jgi:hypothetical protein